MLIRYFLKHIINMKKYRIIMLISFLLLLMSINVNASKRTLPLIGTTIVVDIGHGGKDPGTIHQEVLEKNINLEIGLKLEKELIKSGAVVLLTRDDDFDLSSPNVGKRKKSDFDNRITLINESNASMYISIHQNFLEQKKYNGPQVFYDTVLEKNIIIAKIIQGQLNQEVNGKRSIKRSLNSMYLYKKLKIPGVLIECGFISNYADRKRLQEADYQDKLVKAITRGIIESL